MENTPERLHHQDTSGSSGKQTMSSTLKNRLKRARRSFTSPLSVVKRLKIDEDELLHCSEEQPHRCEQTDEEGEVDVNRNKTMREPTTNLKSIKPKLSQDSDADLPQLRDQLKKNIKIKSETLRRLKLVKMYRTKNDLTQLQGLIEKWRHCVQAVLYELQTELPTDGRKASLSQLIDQFGLEDKILHFDRAQEDFTDS